MRTIIIMEKENIVEMQKVINICFVAYFMLSIICGAVLYNRLEQTRHELESVRMELSAATDRQSELAEILRRDGEILCESSTTISGIRSQIAAIRESYEAMENIICNNNRSSDK